MTIKTRGPSFALAVVAKCMKAFLFRRRLARMAADRHAAHQARRVSCKRLAMQLFPAPQWVFATYLQCLHQQLAATAAAFAAATSTTASSTATTSGGRNSVSQGGGRGDDGALRDTMDASTVATALKHQQRKRRSTMPFASLAAVVEQQANGAPTTSQLKRRQSVTLGKRYTTLLLKLRQMVDAIGFGPTGKGIVAARDTANRAAQSNTLWLSFLADLDRDRALNRYTLRVNGAAAATRSSQAVSASHAGGSGAGTGEQVLPADLDDSEGRRYSESMRGDIVGLADAVSAEASRGKGGLLARLLHKDRGGGGASKAAARKSGKGLSGARRGLAFWRSGRMSQPQAALFIQRVWRGHVARRHVAERIRLRLEVTRTDEWRRYDFDADSDRRCLCRVI
jgi:hypothetical protein